MKKQISYLSVAILSAGLFFTSCKKDNKTTTDNTTELKVQSDDQALFSNETDAITDDANAALENNGGSYVGARPLSPLPFACNASVSVDTTSDPNIKTITITYSGNDCVGRNRSRTGTVVISFDRSFRWSAAGAHYTITAQNLKITRLSDNKSITINGERTITNVSGGRLVNLATRTNPIVHHITSTGTSVTFDDGTQRSWQVDKTRTFAYDNGIVISVTGTGTDGNAEWGTNRFGHTFASAILEPMVVKQSCDFRLVSGKLRHTGPAATTTTTFGLDAQGQPVTTCQTVYYYKVEWTGANGNSYSYIGRY